MNPWEEDYPGGHELLSDDEREKITSNFSDLVLKMPNNPLFWCHLIKWRVVDSAKKDELTNVTGSSESEQVRELLSNEILRGPKWKYYALIHALVKTGQLGAVGTLGEIPEQFMDIQYPYRISETNQRLLTEEEEDKIRSVFPKLTRTIALGPRFWAIMIQLNVLEQERRDEIIDGKKRSKAQQIRSLLDMILRGPKWKYHRFLIVLGESYNEHILKYVLTPYDRCKGMCTCEGLLSESEKQTITDKYRRLTHCISVGECFWACLIKYGVIDHKEKEVLKCDDIKSSIQQSRNFLQNVILRGPKWKYHALMKTFVDVNCPFLLKLVGEDCQKYIS